METCFFSKYNKILFNLYNPNNKSVRVKENFQLIEHRSIIDKVGSSLHTVIIDFRISSRTEREKKGEGAKRRVTSEGQNSHCQPGNVSRGAWRKGGGSITRSRAEPRFAHSQRRVRRVAASSVDPRSPTFADVIRATYRPRARLRRRRALSLARPEARYSFAHLRLPPTLSLSSSPALPPSPPIPKLPISLRSIPLRFAFPFGFSGLAQLARG